MKIKERDMFPTIVRNALENKSSRRPIESEFIIAGRMGYKKRLEKEKEALESVNGFLRARIQELMDVVKEQERRMEMLKEDNAILRSHVRRLRRN